MVGRIALWLAIGGVALLLVACAPAAPPPAEPDATVPSAETAPTEPPPTSEPPTPTTALPTATAAPPTPVPPTAVPPTDTPAPTPLAAATRPPRPAVDAPLEVVAAADLVYGTGAADGEPWLLDEYAPAEPGPWPVVVFLHGTGQSRVLYKQLGEALAARGAAVSVIDYPWIHPRGASIGGGQGYRAMAEAAGCALRFATERAAAAGNEPAAVVLTGFSLGAGVAAQVALAGDSLDARLDDFAAAGGAERQVACAAAGGSTAVDALVGVGGPYEAFAGYPGEYGIEALQEKDPALWELLSTPVGLHPALVVRLLHGEADREVSPETSATFAALLQEAGYDAEHLPFDGGHVVPLDLLVETVLAAAWGE